MIKLQLLLRHPGAEPELDPALRAQLEALGLTLTGTGRATLSATMQEADFARLFGAPPQPVLAAAPLAAPDLPVPPALMDAVSLITVAPRHVATNQPPTE
jgi:hypothetical protein